MKEAFPEIARVAVAIYDHGTDRLKTFIHSTEGAVPFSHYEAALGEVPILASLAAAHQDRRVSDLTVLGPDHVRSQKVIEAGYLSSYTRPFFNRGQLIGFLFFDARKKAYFDNITLHHLSTFSHLISLLVINGLTPAQMLRSSVNVARDLSRYRDQETGAHLDRMSRYARVIANDIAVEKALSDEFVEFVFLFSPLHDIGKIGIEDSILLKPAQLTEAEFAIMKTHVTKGVRMVDAIIGDFGLTDLPHTEMLRNIVRFHHECFDGNGYMEGLIGEAIPLEARIVMVADIFDALTSKRPYKEAWSVERALQFLKDKSGTMLDPRCVNALIENLSEIETIKARFTDDEIEEVGFREAYFSEI
ncbi:MAG: HD domain-containing protein [Rhodospirillaceae bacterium]|nr:HD domain-containing protein [Rhodospirillaceae bacterium]